MHRSWPSSWPHFWPVKWAFVGWNLLKESRKGPKFNQLTLPETNSSPLKIDGWKTTFLLGKPIFRGELLVLGSVTKFLPMFPGYQGKLHSNSVVDHLHLVKLTTQNPTRSILPSYVPSLGSKMYNIWSRYNITIMKYIYMYYIYMSLNMLYVYIYVTLPFQVDLSLFFQERDSPCRKVHETKKQIQAKKITFFPSFSCEYVGSLVHVVLHTTPWIS